MMMENIQFGRVENKPSCFYLTPLYHKNMVMNQRKKSSFALLLKVLIRQCGKWFMAVWKAQPNNSNNKYAKTAKTPDGEEEEKMADEHF